MLRLSTDLTTFIESARHYRVASLPVAQLLLEVHQALKSSAQ